jgi:tetratricopeptide (TPR) repeat protein
MILVRDVFQLHFGKAKEALALAKEDQAIARRHGFQPARILTDLTGEYYTLVMESTAETLGEMETALQEATQSQEWRDWYARFVPLVRCGRREILSSRMRGLKAYREAGKLDGKGRRRRGHDPPSRSSNGLAGRIALPPYRYDAPVRHTLGAALLGLNRPKEAEAVYREDLKENRENGWALFGLAKSLRLQGDLKSAAVVEARFKRAWKDADVTLASLD